jgi:hypothetical protein
MYKTKTNKINQLITVGVYTEGSKDSKIIDYLVEISQFKYHTNNCQSYFNSGKGGDPHTILVGCKKWKQNTEFDAMLCVVDLDRIYNNNDLNIDLYIKNLELEAKEAGIFIIWQDKNLEDELKSALKLPKKTSKSKVFSIVKKNPEALLNTSYYSKVLKVYKLALNL